MYTERWKQYLLCGVKALFPGEVGEIVPYIIGYYVNTSY